MLPPPWLARTHRRDGSILCGRLSRWKFLSLLFLFFLPYSIYKRQIITLCQFGTVLRTRAMCRRSITIRVCVCVCREGKICMIINTSQPTETDACAGKWPEHGGGSDRNEWLYPRLRLVLVSAWHGNNRSQRQRRRDAAPNSLHYAKGIYMPSRQTQPATTVATAGWTGMVVGVGRQKTTYAR